MGDISMGEAVTATGQPLSAAGDAFRTKPGTPMTGSYSTNQMDDFYTALALGHVKPSSIMNYVQHLYVAERLPAGARFADVCCGRGLQLPVLYRYAPHIGSYTGYDIAPANLGEARDRIGSLDAAYGGRPFSIELVECDVSQPWPERPLYDAAVYTSALEHLPRDLAAASLRNTATALKPGGVLYLSTPNTPAGSPPQHRVHVYEWHRDELAVVLDAAGLHIDDTIGLLPPETGTDEAITAAWGADAARWHARLRQVIPAPFLDTVTAAALPGAAAELLYVCTRRPS
jgi:SAM-dependent methyltransferase